MEPTVAIARNEPMHPLAIVQQALEMKVDAAQMKMILDLQERHDANVARKAFYEAMTAFAKEPVELVKDKLVKYATAKGETSYMHAELDQVSDKIASALSLHDLHHSWETEQTPDGMISVTCIIAHVLGHSKRVTLKSAPDPTGSKNAIQAISSATTYLQRYTLLLATGKAARGMDDDGKGSESSAVISEGQEQSLAAWIEQAYPTGPMLERFMVWLKEAAGVDSIAKIPVKKYQQVFDAVKGVAEKRAKK